MLILKQQSNGALRLSVKEFGLDLWNLKFELVVFQLKNMWWWWGYMRSVNEI